MSLKKILEAARNELAQKEKVREKAYADMRRTISTSKQAILFIHKGKLHEAERLIKNARRLIVRTRRRATISPELVFSGMFSAALQEYSEANILLGLISRSRFVAPSEIDVPSSDYILGLSDVIGECRRLALDALRRGDVEDAERKLKIMDEIYVETLGMDESYMLVSGLRRKSDIARRIIETTRGDVTQEARRTALERQMERLEKLLKKEKA